MNPSLEHPIIVKVGGSLFDLPDLGGRLQQWLAELATPYIILVPGGGITADVIRELDRVHGLGEERSHWLALRSLTLNAHVLAELLPGSQVAGTFAECSAAHAARQVAIIDAWKFAADDESQPDHLPHNWNATSDSVAARIAVCCQAYRLVLLKSTSMPEGSDLAEAALAGIVDSCFAEVVRKGKVSVRVVNLR